MDIEWGRDGEDGKLYILQARPETVKSQEKRKDVLTRYISAAGKGWLYARDHPEEAVDYVLKSASGLERDMEIPTWKVSIPYISSSVTQQQGWGYMDPQVWGNLSDTYLSLDQIPKKVTAEEVMTNEIVAAAKTPKF